MFEGWPMVGHVMIFRSEIKIFHRETLVSLRRLYTFLINQIADLNKQISSLHLTERKTFYILKVK